MLARIRSCQQFSLLEAQCVGRFFWRQRLPVRFLLSESPIEKEGKDCLRSLWARTLTDMGDLNYLEMRRETMKIKFKRITPDLMVLDVARTVKFYAEKLGFKIAMLVSENEKTIETRLDDSKKYVYAMVSRNDVFVMFMRKDVYEEDVRALKGFPIGASATFYCDVDNVDELYDFCKGNGVELITDLSTTWYGMKEFYIKDCNGYILGFAEKAK